MERSLLWFVLAAGAAGWCTAVALGLACRGRRAGPGPAFVWLSLIAPLAAFALSNVDAAPFSPGGGLGLGILLGGVAAAGALYGLVSLSLAGAGAHGAASAVAGGLCAAAVAPALGLLWRWDASLDALAGAAAGWVAVAAVWLTGLATSTEAPSEEPALERRRAAVAATLVAAGYGVTVAAAAMLATLRDTQAPPAGPGEWAATALAVSVIVPALVLVVALPSAALVRIRLRVPLGGLVSAAASRLFPSETSRRAAERGWRLALFAALAYGAATVLAWQIAPVSGLDEVVLLGLGAAVVCRWLAREEWSSEPDEASRGYHAALGLLVVLGGLTASYYYHAGWAMAVALLAAWGVGALALCSAIESPVASSDQTAPAAASADAFARLLCFGVPLVLYRVVSSRFEDQLRVPSFGDQFGVVGLLVGALLPGLLAGHALAPGLGAIGALVRLPITGLLTVLVPALLLMVFGDRFTAALLVGLALGVAWSPLRVARAGAVGERLRDHHALAAVLALAIAVVFAQATGLLVELGPLQRADKIRAIAWSAIAMGALWALADASARIAAWRARRRAATEGAPR